MGLMMKLPPPLATPRSCASKLEGPEADTSTTPPAEERESTSSSMAIPAGRKCATPPMVSSGGVPRSTRPPDDSGSPSSDPASPYSRRIRAPVPSRRNRSLPPVTMITEPEDA
eukprot:scaffold7358_cov252-Pinguiococcus_pyrenoidosus.AAC.3